MSAPAVRCLGVTKRFPGVVALNDVSFEVAAGTCHAVCGENGAGKSTLGRILAGIEWPDAGEVALAGTPVRFAGPREALAAGVAMVHQEPAFCENLTVAENLSLGRVPARAGFVRREALRARARELLDAIGADVDPDRVVGTLPVAEQQLVQIAAAVGAGARVLIFDEPTSSLGDREAERLFGLIGQLTARGVAVLYVTHRMPEIFRLASRVTVLRDGGHVATRPVAEVDEGSLVRAMIGRALEQYFPTHVATPPGAERLRVEGLTSAGRFAGINLVLRAGEVVGLAGLVGAGRSEIAQALFGLDARAVGEVFVRGRRVVLRSAAAALAHGIGLVPENRKRQGLVLSLLARENAALPTLRSRHRAGWIDRAAESRDVGEWFDRLHFQADPESLTATLSGGNQQKVVLAKWLAAKCDVLILDEPTRGVDVGAKAEFHAWIDRLASEGRAVLLISSELPELLNLSSRILVLRTGRLVGELPRGEATQERVLRMMSGLAPDDVSRG